jgi:hypothetical protein
MTSFTAEFAFVVVTEVGTYADTLENVAGYPTQSCHLSFGWIHFGNTYHMDDGSLLEELYLT